MIIIGLDLSLSDTGICIKLENNQFIFKNIQTKKTDDKYSDQKRYEIIKNRLKDIFNILPEILFNSETKVIIEGYAYQSKGSNSFKLIELGGIVKQMIYDNFDFDVDFVSSTTWKRELFGKGFGLAKKPIIKQKVKEIFEIEFENQNICDAFCLCKYGEIEVNNAMSS